MRLCNECKEAPAGVGLLCRRCAQAEDEKQRALFAKDGKGKFQPRKIRSLSRRGSEERGRGALNVRERSWDDHDVGGDAG